MTPELLNKKSEDDEVFSAPINMQSIAYGPVQSRRLKSSLGINLLSQAEKICNFNCPYCDLGLTKIKMSQVKKNTLFPTVKEVEDAIRNKIVELTKAKRSIDYLTFSGFGEPTLHPDFLEIVTMVIKIRNQLTPQTKITALTNGSMLNNSQVVRALNLLDERMVKLDAGNDDILNLVNAPLTRTSISRIIQGTKSLKDLIIQTMFVQGDINNMTSDHIDEWIEAIGLIKPKAVHLVGLNKSPALLSIKPVSRQRLKEISLLLEKRTKIPSLIFS
jgi:wyosine [tRNA(Phe)-imidazoG37] synthetase (radical SAM superfamily)